MIPRTLVPRNINPAAQQDGERPRRIATPLDGRVLVLPSMQQGPLQVESSIPAHLPLASVAERQLVPRDLPPLPADARLPRQPVIPTRLDTRLLIPPDARPAPLELSRPLPAEAIGDVVDPDLFTTGEVTLLPRPVEITSQVWRWPTLLSSALVHALLLALILVHPKLFPYEPPTEEEIARAHRQLGLVYLPPPPVDLVPAPAVPPQQSPQIRIDPRMFRPQAEPPQQDIEIPGPRTGEVSPGDAGRPSEPGREFGTGERAERPQPQRGPEIARLEPVPEVRPGNGPALDLGLRPRSPGTALEEQLREALRNPGGGSYRLGDVGPGGPGGGGGQGFHDGLVQILTPTQGVDFTNYMGRVLARVKRNWYAVIPESARLGEQGKVVIQFKILSNGHVPYPEPLLVATSGREPLDRAALSAIHASNPFEPLPQQFTGPYIELRFTFFYNLPIDYQ
jgi:TonB family protein